MQLLDGAPPSFNEDKAGLQLRAQRRNPVSTVGLSTTLPRALDGSTCCMDPVSSGESAAAKSCIAGAGPPLSADGEKGSDVDYESSKGARCRLEPRVCSPVARTRPSHWCQRARIVAWSGKPPVQQGSARATHSLEVQSRIAGGCPGASKRIAHARAGPNFCLGDAASGALLRAH